MSRAEKAPLSSWKTAYAACGTTPKIVQASVSAVPCWAMWFRVSSMVWNTPDEEGLLYLVPRNVPRRSASAEVRQYCHTSRDLAGSSGAAVIVFTLS